MSDLSNLSRPEGAHRSSKRLGRGPGSGKGKTSGKGHKGQKARTGHHGIPSWFEGGQMPLQRRVPKRGFNNANFRTTFEIVNIGDLARIEGDEVSPETLHEKRLVDLGKGRKVKLLAEGTIERKLTVRVHAASAAAKAKIEAAGGTLELLES
ncbi:MAG: 50S ribosomal protein L15 [Longimicrobiales bacterium]